MEAQLRPRLPNHPEALPCRLKSPSVDSPVAHTSYDNQGGLRPGDLNGIERDDLASARGCPEPRGQPGRGRNTPQIKKGEIKITRRVPLRRPPLTLAEDLDGDAVSCVLTWWHPTFPKAWPPAGERDRHQKGLLMVMD